MYISTQGYGLYEYNVDLHKVTAHFKEITGLWNDKPTELHFNHDSSSLLISYRSKGIQSFPINDSPLSYLLPSKGAINGIYVDDTDQTYILTESKGVDVIDQNGDFVLNYSQEYSKVLGDIQDYSVDISGTLIIASLDQITQFSNNTWATRSLDDFGTIYEMTANAPHRITTSNGIYRILVGDHSDTLYSDHTYSIFNTDKDIYDIHNINDTLIAVVSASGILSICERDTCRSYKVPFVNKMITGSRGSLILATPQGLYQFDDNRLVKLYNQSWLLGQSNITDIIYDKAKKSYWAVCDNKIYSISDSTSGLRRLPYNRHNYLL